MSNSDRCWRWRQRQKMGVMTLPFEIKKSEVETLVATGRLAPERKTDRLAILISLYPVIDLDRTFANLRKTRT